MTDKIQSMSDALKTNNQRANPSPSNETSALPATLTSSSTSNPPRTAYLLPPHLPLPLQNLRPLREPDRKRPPKIPLMRLWTKSPPLLPEPPSPKLQLRPTLPPPLWPAG
ncbi:hypothetical protein KEM48_012959 [Puccinia striiformis f. sp. tritici PST-130]|nr:hypothetical protein KEM48_012959 [Puccinia striiformis f. sp. tritici PST-130]